MWGFKIKTINILKETNLFLIFNTIKKITLYKQVLFSGSSWTQKNTSRAFFVSHACKKNVS